jgi:GT2 family glycosyltransferase
VAASIDVIVPVHDHYELTDRCLAHLAAQTVGHEVIVVDDDSSDGTPERLRRHWPAVRVLELGTNHGYTHAVNRGVGAGSGEYIVLLNNDVELEPEALEWMVTPLLEDERVGSVASVMLAPGGDAIDSVGVSADVTLAGFARLQGSRREAAGSPAPVLAGPEGTAGAYRRSAWERVGGLDERIRAYMEILDLALRLRSAGWGSVVAREAVGVHLGSRSYGRRSAAQRRLAGFSRGYLLRRYGVLRRRSGPRAALTEAIIVLGDAVLCRDVQALAGRLEGWRAAAGLPRHPWPPGEALDSSITLRGSLALRSGAIAN